MWPKGQLTPQIIFLVVGSRQTVGRKGAKNESQSNQIFHLDTSVVKLSLTNVYHTRVPGSWLITPGFYVWRKRVFYMTQKILDFENVSFLYSFTRITFTKRPKMPSSKLWSGTAWIRTCMCKIQRLKRSSCLGGVKLHTIWSTISSPVHLSWILSFSLKINK